jgi:hypothetical protein
MRLRKGLREKMPEASVFGMEEALAKISTSLMEAGDESLFSITDITPEEVFKLSFLISFANKVGSELMIEWINDFLRLRISRLRMGRKEMLMLGVGTRDYSEKKGRSGISDLFSGLKG